MKSSSPDATRAADGRTRDTVVRLLLEHGPTTTTALAGRLDLSPAAVRRHLDALVAEGDVTTRDAPQGAGRGRGRPARQHLLTREGRTRAGHGGHDAAELAVAALRHLSEAAGEDAVREFARRRVAALVADHGGEILAHAGRAERVEALAGALSAAGYAASARPARGPVAPPGGATSGPGGEQLCQHHCPVAHVAAEFPQLCEAETEVFAQMLGTHVQRLSTIARGDAACTTHVPAETVPVRTTAAPGRTTTTDSPPTTTVGSADPAERQVV